MSQEPKVVGGQQAGSQGTASGLKGGTVFIISAPSGSGKTTLTNELLRLVPGLDFSVSYTTRRPRGSEQEGHDYHFVSQEQFEQMRDRGEFLEHADVFGNCYGTAKRYLEEARHRGHDLVLDIDVQGARQVKQKIPDAVSIFILPPSRQVLEFRLRNRSHAEHMDSEEVIERRLAEARTEIENYPNYDYILVNDRLENSIAQLKAIVAAERLKRSGARLSADGDEVRTTAQACLLPNVRQRAQQILDSFATPAPRPHNEVK
jgi:guanylate kinase